MKMDIKIWVTVSLSLGAPALTVGWEVCAGRAGKVSECSLCAT